MADEEDMILAFLNKQRQEYSEFLDSAAPSFLETVKPQFEGMVAAVEKVRTEQISLINKLEGQQTPSTPTVNQGQETSQQLLQDDRVHKNHH